MTTTANVCKEAELLASDIGLKILLCLNTVISIAAILAEAVAIKWITLRMAVHKNVKILIIAHQLFLIAHCIARIGAHTADLVAFSAKRKDPCNFLSDSTRCFILRAPVTATFFLNGCSVAGIVAERTVATLFSSKYERMGKSASVIIVFAEIGTSLALLLGSTVDDEMFGDTKSAYCSALSKQNRDRAVAVLAASFVINAAAIVLLVFLLMVNKNSKKSHISTNLSHRYQMNENIASLNTLLPLLTFQSIIYGIFISAFLAYFLLNPPWTLRSYALFLESVQLTPLYSLIFPLALIYARRLVQKRVKATLHCSMHVSKDIIEKHYFEKLFDFSKSKPSKSPILQNQSRTVHRKK